VGEFMTWMTVVVVTLYVLQQRPAERDIDDLLAATDPENGNTLIHSGAHQRYLGQIQGVIDVRSIVTARLAVDGWIDVPSTRDEQPIDAAERSYRLVRQLPMRLGTQGDRLAAGGFHRASVS